MLRCCPAHLHTDTLLSLCMWFCAGLQQNGLQSGAGQRHPDFASCRAARAAGGRPPSNNHCLTSSSALGPWARARSPHLLWAARRTGEPSHAWKSLCMFWLCNWVFSGFYFRTVKSWCLSLELIRPPSLWPSSPGCRSSPSPPGCSSTSTEGALWPKLPNLMRWKTSCCGYYLHVLSHIPSHLISQTTNIKDESLNDNYCHLSAFFFLFFLWSQNYLRTWSRELNVPILSVDYSLSPEAPFPRALEECFYAYCWAVRNCHLLGMGYGRCHNSYNISLTLPKLGLHLNSVQWYQWEEGSSSKSLCWCCFSHE